MENILTTLLTGNIGTVIIVIILWKSGVLKYLLNGKRNFDDGQSLTTITEVANTVAKLEYHFNNETTIILQEIKYELREQNQKLDKISDGVIFIKEKLKNDYN